MENISISFIIPCYNCASTIKESIDSIFNLGLKKFEVCIVDDGSIDKTYSIILDYQKRYPNHVKIGRNQVNIGGGLTRNECFKMTRFDYIFMLDSDNVLERKSFLYLISKINRDDKIITFEKIRFFYTIPIIKAKFFYKNFIFLPDRMVFEDIRKTINHPAMDGNYLFKREVFEMASGYEKDAGVDTWGFGYKILSIGYQFKIIKNTEYYHRVHRKSYWFRNIDQNFENWRSFLLRYKKGLTDVELASLADGKDVINILLIKRNDFMREEISCMFKILLKIYYVLWRIPKPKN